LVAAATHYLAQVIMAAMVVGDPDYVVFAGALDFPKAKKRTRLGMSKPRSPKIRIGQNSDSL